MRSILKVYSVLLLFVSCKVLPLYQETLINTEQQVTLGSVGSDKGFILQSGFDSSAIPNYTVPIKISVSKMSFTKSTYKTFLKAKESQSLDINIQFIDSLKEKPKFIRLQIADKVVLTTALNKKENTNVKDYLSFNPYASIITSVSLAVNQQDIEKLTRAESVFLVEKGLKNYVLKLYVTGKKTEQVLFNQGVVFAYKTSHCCWQENSQYELNIIDLVTEYNDCPNKSYRNSRRAKKKINYFKL